MNRETVLLDLNHLKTQTINKKQYEKQNEISNDHYRDGNDITSYAELSEI